jgi:DNA-directed RNA polymerase specialized sigma24 family protein
MSTQARAETVLSRLDQIPTRWSLLGLAHRGAARGSNEARNVLVLRYARAIRNYVGALLRCEQGADEVSQEVVVRLLRGQFAAASPRRGSLRRMLMVAAHNQVRTYWSRRQRKAGVDFDLGTVASGEEHVLERQAQESWRGAVLSLAWKAMEEWERRQSGSVACTVLRLRADFPDDDSEELAARLSAKTGRTFRADNTRQQLRRARVRFAEALLEEVARGLDEPTPERVEEELIELGLLPYVADLLPADWRSRGELVEA